MLEVRGVAFDLEGTVIDLETQHHLGHLNAAADIGIKLNLQEALERLPHFIGGPDELVAMDLWRISDGSVSQEEILGLTLKYFQEALQTTVIESRVGFREFLEELKSRDIPTSIGSATSRATAGTYLTRSGLADLFPANRIILGEDVLNPKPAPDVYIESARRIGILTQELLVFEDSPRGIKAAVAAGAPVIGMPVYDLPEVSNLLINAGAKLVFNSWNHVSINSLGNAGYTFLNSRQLQI